MFSKRRPPQALNFTNGCRNALVQAREEADKLAHSYVGTEHILLAVVKSPDDGVPRLIAELSLSRNRVRRDVEALVENIRAPRLPRDGAELPYTSRAKKVLELAMREARELAHGAVTVGHLFLALITKEKGIAAQVLRSLGVTYAAARAGVAGLAAHRDKNFSVQIDDSSDKSIYEQIVAQVQEAVATGDLISGERLPTVRELADDLDIAPGTVARAYSELERLGVVMTDGVRGTSIAQRDERTLPGSLRPETFVGLLRPVAVAAFHLGASAPQVRQALEQAMRDILPTAPPP